MITDINGNNTRTSPDNTPRSKRNGKRNDIPLPHEKGEEKRKQAMLSGITPQVLGQEKNEAKNDVIKKAAQELESSIRREHIEREFYMNEDIRMPVVRITNTKTDQVIGQYPSELYISLVKKMKDMQKQFWDKTI
ncbi:MAG: flagellar protein FlaG [Mucispirillum sp.]|nr:flagellar protein FlaG [Mucispirillum sp.]